MSVTRRSDVRPAFQNAPNVAQLAISPPDAAIAHLQQMPTIRGVSQKRAAGIAPRRRPALGQRPYAHFGSPSLLAGASAVEPTYTAHVLVVVVWVTLAVNPSAVTTMVGPTTPVVVAYAVPRLLVYFTESAKYASSAVIRFRRSDFIDARYAFSFVFANFGIAIAAKMPMITTTIRSSISVKPLRLISL